MPQDSRRNCYSEESHHPDRFTDSKTYDTTIALVNENDLRKDQRGQADPRPVFMETGIVTRSKGSAYIEVGNTKITCACYGPKQLQSKESDFCKGALVCEMKYASFASAVHKTDQSNLLEKELSRLVVDALSPCVMLESFPKAQVDIYITVLEDGGSVLAAAITAASLALADSGIEMYGLVVGASLRQYGDWTLIDPTTEEETRRAEPGNSSGCLTIAYMMSLSQISMLSQQGYLAHQELTQGIATLTEVCRDVYPLMQRCLMASVSRKIKEDAE